ncbi:hypothetical protein BDE02_17G073000 [Populus trichocarpa]|nr:hypothetical protein BDE02_17G073000 [Populus trichocarpa]
MVQEAIDGVPLRNTCRTVIRVPPGVYWQPVPEVTSLTWNNTSTKIDHQQASRVIETGTFRCGTVIVEGEGFITETITFEKFSPEVLGPFVFIPVFVGVMSNCDFCSGQAVAIRVTADWYAFYNCLFIGWQDTLYLHYGKQYLKDCYIEGYVDFIFGNITALLEHCHIQCKSAGLLIAQSIKSSQESTGYVFPRWGTSYMCLERPWGLFGRIIVADMALRIPYSA